MATATRSTKKAPAKAAPKKTAPKGKFVIYGTAGGQQGNVRDDYGFHWGVRDPKIYPSAAAVKRAIKKAHAGDPYPDTDVAPARMIRHRDGTVDYKVVEN